MEKASTDMGDVESHVLFIPAIVMIMIITVSVVSVFYLPPFSRGLKINKFVF